MKLVTGALVALTMAAPGVAAAGPIANGQGWTGFYVGGHAGGVNAGFDGIFDSADSPDRQDDLSDADYWGFAGGGQIGYDMQFGRVVLGVVGDASYLVGEGDTSSATNDGVFEAGFNWVASARVRAGYPVADFMPYATVGIAFAELELDHQFTASDIPEANGNKTLNETAYVVGVGMEWAAFGNVTIGAEALFYGWDIQDDLTGLGVDRDAGDFLDVDRMMQYRLTANYRF